MEVSGVTTVGFITASRLEISGGANVSGVLTASQIKIGNSDVVDNLVGYAYSAFITDNGGIGLHTTSKIGINTTTSPGTSDPALSVFGDAKITGNSNITGNVNITGDVDVNITGDVNITSDANITASEFSGFLSGDVNSTGVSTFTSLEVGASITASSGIVTATTFSGNLSGTATTATNLANGANINTGTISDDRLPDTITSNINILSGTSYFSQIGVNTTIPESDIHVRKNIQAEIQVTSNSNASLVGLGRSNNITGYNGVLRYGNTDGAFAYSDAYSLDIMNYGTGNINYYLNPSEIVGTTGGFFWHKETNRLMALTSVGNLGLGITNPTRKLEVSGTAYVSGDVEFGDNLDVNTNIIVGINGRIGINSSSPAEKLDVVGNIVSTGSITAGSISTTNGTSSQFLKADGSIDENTYLISTSDGSGLTGIVTSLVAGSNITVSGSGNVTVAAVSSPSFGGSVTATDGFTSGVGAAVQISVVGSTLTFNVVGVGSTSLTLS